MPCSLYNSELYTFLSKEYVLNLEKDPCYKSSTTSLLFKSRLDDSHAAVRLFGVILED